MSDAIRSVPNWSFFNSATRKASMAGVCLSEPERLPFTCPDFVVRGCCESVIGDYLLPTITHYTVVLYVLITG